MSIMDLYSALDILSTTESNTIKYSDNTKEYIIMALVTIAIVILLFFIRYKWKKSFRKKWKIEKTKKSSKKEEKNKNNSSIR